MLHSALGVIFLPGSQPGKQTGSQLIHFISNANHLQVCVYSLSGVTKHCILAQTVDHVGLLPCMQYPAILSQLQPSAVRGVYV